MAWIRNDEVKNIREELKRQFPSWKFSVTGGNSSSLNIRILKSTLDFAGDYIESRNEDYYEMLKAEYASINHYHFESSFKGETLEALKKIDKIARSQGWYDKSDAMTDYFDTAYYLNFHVGYWSDKKGKVYHEKIEAKSSAPAPAGDLNFEDIFAGGTVKAFVHTQSGEELSVLKLAVKLSRDNFKAFNIWLKKNDKGYYSRYAGGFILTNDNKKSVA